MSFVDRKINRPGTTRRVRMVGQDYAYPGYYFVTVCTDDRQELFGRISRGEIMYSPAGQMIDGVIVGLGAQFSTVIVDSYVVMPNHIHVLIGLSVRVGDVAVGENLSDVIRVLKNSSHRRYGIGVKQQGWSPYQGNLWQSGFHDHIVRNERELHTLRRYMAENVERWEQDTFHDS